MSFKAALSLALVLLVPLASSQITRTVTVAAPQQTSESYSSSDVFLRDSLATHNRFRLQHDAEPLKWNESLAKVATSWASACVWKHSGGESGENLAAGFDNVTAAVGAWGDERRFYDWKKPDFTEATGHFTQVVWRDTKTVGCGRKYCGSKTTPGWYVVCEYWPAGNVIGSFAENVMPLSSNVPPTNAPSSAPSTTPTKGSSSSTPTGGRRTREGWFAASSGVERNRGRGYVGSCIAALTFLLFDPVW